MAEISVIIPCYNVGNYIDRCLACIVQQTIGLDLLEIICVNDVSTDDTWQHLQKWEQMYPEHILLINSEVNGRQGTARNIGLRYASTPWIAYLDSDDWIELDYFEQLYTIALQYQCEVVCCQSERDFSIETSFLTDRSCQRESRMMVIDTYEKRKLFFSLESMSFAAWGKLIQKSLLLDNQIFFPEHLAYEDCYWGPMLHMYVKRVYLLEEKLYHYFVNRDSTVLKPNMDYHVDCITVQLMKWQEWVKRGLLELYREELECDFVCTCYLGMMKALLLRYDEPSYSLYQLAKAVTLERIPDYRQNHYIMNTLPELYTILLESLRLPMTREDFKQLTASAKAYWNAEKNT